MKLSFVVHVPERDKDFEKFEAKLRKLKELGYHGVELAIKNPFTVNVERIKKIVDIRGLAVSAIDTGAGYIGGGPSLNNLNSQLRQEAVETMKGYINVAAFFRTKVTISTIRGLFKEDPEAQKEIFKKSLEECRRYARKCSVTLLLEPLHRFEMDFINNADEALEFLLENKFYGIKILLDTFHMNIEDASIPESILRVSSMRLLGHIHMADSNRLAPGQGHFNFEEFFSVLKKIGYKGFLTIEVIHPSNPPFNLMAEKSIKYLKKYLKNARR